MSNLRHLLEMSGEYRSYRERIDNMGTLGPVPGNREFDLKIFRLKRGTAVSRGWCTSEGKESVFTVYPPPKTNAGV